MTEQLNVQQMAQRLTAADNILILCHKNPDGDTIGCGSALYYALKALDKNAAVLCSDAIPSRYAFTNARLFKGEFEPKTVVAVDVASVQLFGEGNGVPQFSRHVDLCIDHHAGNSGYADFTLLNGSAAAAAELLYEVINAMGVAITPHIADCLYTGLATDTGCFRYSNTTPSALRMAADLAELGLELHELNYRLFMLKSRARMMLEARVVNDAHFYKDGKIAVAVVTQELRRELHAEEDDMDDIGTLMRCIEGVEVGVLMKETPQGAYKVSFRSAQHINVSEVAQEFGGGGHRRASGCLIAGPEQQAEKALVEAIERAYAAL